jgi:hypothetical protein
MANSKTDKYSFTWSDDDLKAVGDEAEKFRDEYKKSGQAFQAGIPICFLGDGNYVFRIYPDRDPNGFARLIKRAHIHNKKTGVEGVYLRCWEDDRVNKLFREAEEAGLEKLWGYHIYQYRSREIGYMMAHLYETPPNNEYALPKKSYGLILDKRQIFAVQDFIAELTPEDKRQMLDPNNAAPGIKLSITRGSGKANVSCGIASMKRLELPPLEFKDEDGNPIEYKGLDSVYITEEDRISDENFFKLRQAVIEEIANFKSAGGQVKDNSAEAHKIGNGSKEPEEKVQEKVVPKETKQDRNPLPDVKPTESKLAPSASEAENGVRCRLADQCKISPSLAATYPDAAFGNKPDKITPYCMVCDFEVECKELTLKKKAA